MSVKVEFHELGEVKTANWDMTLDNGVIICFDMVTEKYHLGKMNHEREQVEFVSTFDNFDQAYTVAKGY